MLLEGKINWEGKIELEERVQTCKVMGKIVATFVDASTIDGYWLNPAGAQKIGFQNLGISIRRFENSALPPL